MATYLVTGGAGFIGAALTRRLLALGHEVFVVDNLTTGHEKNIPKDALFQHGNIQDEMVYRRLPPRRFAAIYHIAGQSSGEISFDDPVYDLQTNTQSTLLLLKFAIQNGCQRILYASSMSVYGEQPDMPVTEEAMPVPNSFYGVGKLASENYLRIYRQYGLESASLRLFNVYGPGQNMLNLRQGMVSIFLAHAINRHHISVKGNKERYRDFVYIDDVVEAFIALESMQSVSSMVYNVGSGVRTTVGELIKKICAYMPFEVSESYEGSTPGDIFGITSDCTKIFQEAGWQGEISLDTGLKRMVTWALNAAPDRF